MAFLRLSERPRPLGGVRPNSEDVTSHSTAQPKNSRRALPRVVVGASLITVSVVGLTYAFSATSRTVTTAVLVPSADIPPDQALVPSDFTSLKLALPKALAGSFIADPSELVGKVGLSMLKQGQPVEPQELSIAPPNADRVLTLEVPSAQAVEGELIPGDRVDVLATYGTGASATTITAGQSVLVLTSQALQGSFASGGSRTISITLAATSYTEAMAIAQAQIAAKVTLVRSTGSAKPTNAQLIYPPGTTLAPLPGQNFASTATQSVP